MRFASAHILAVAGSLSLGTVAHAGSVALDQFGGSVVMQSGSVAGVFDSDSPQLNDSTLDAIHASLGESGIVTDGRISLVLLDTDHGLAFFALVDSTIAGGPAGEVASKVAMSSTAPEDLSRFINDAGSDIEVHIDPPFGLTQTAAGDFMWNALGEGDGFAWAELGVGDGVTFSFAAVDDQDGSTLAGLDSELTFQFLTWDGSQWSTLATGEFNESGQFGFSFTVIPLPAGVLLGGAGLLGIISGRRRLAGR